MGREREREKERETHASPEKLYYLLNLSVYIYLPKMY